MPNKLELPPEGVPMIGITIVIARESLEHRRRGAGPRLMHALQRAEQSGTGSGPQCVHQTTCSTQLACECTRGHSAGRRRAGRQAASWAVCCACHRATFPQSCAYRSRCTRPCTLLHRAGSGLAPADKSSEHNATAACTPANQSSTTLPDSARPAPLE
jgi:hypothetical protein